MKIVCKNCCYKKYRRYVHIFQAFRRFIVFSPSDMVNNENSQKRNKHHRNIIGIPQVTPQMRAVLGNKFPFAGSHNKPKCQQYSDCYEIMAHLFIDNPCSDRGAPRNDKRNLNNTSDHYQKHFQDRFIHLGMERTGIIRNNK